MSLDQVLLDTNIIIDLFSGNPLVSEAVLAKRKVFLPVPALGELYRGAFASVRQAHNLKQIEDFAAEVPVLVCDADTARRYGQMKQSLRAKGKLIPENDLWIAALARQHSIAVMTRDEHFNWVSDIVVDFLAASP